MPSPEGDFIAFDGVIEEYVRPGGDVVIPAEIDGVPTVEIAMEAFVNNTDITAVIIPEGVEKVGHRAFKNCANVVKLELPYSLYEAGTDAFYGLGITEIVIHGNLTKIGYSCFSNGKALADIKISNGVKKIHANAFFFSKPSRVIFPESMDFIAGYSFNYLKTNARIEFVICNPDLDLGRTAPQNVLWEGQMKGQWTDTIFRPWNSSTSHDQVFNVVVPKGSSIAEFCKNWKTNGLLKLGEDSGACNNSYVVQEKDESYFEKIAEEVAAAPTADELRAQLAALEETEAATEAVAEEAPVDERPAEDAE